MSTLHFGKTIHDSLYNLDSKLILTRDSHKDLGVTIQNSLSWDQHINNLCSKAYSCLYLIKRNTQCSHDLHTKRTLYTTLVRSNLTFCSQLWPKLVKAENYWISLSQCACFPEEINSLKIGSDISRRSILMQLNPFLEFSESVDA